MDNGTNLTNNHWKHATCDVLAKVEVKIENLQVSLTKKKYDRDLTEETRNELHDIAKRMRALERKLSKEIVSSCWMV